MPQHVFSSLSNGFLVDQVFRTNVFRDGVTTPGTTTQRQGRCEFEVVQVTDTTLRGRGVDQDTRGFHHLTEVSNAFWLVILVSVQAGGEGSEKEPETVYVQAVGAQVYLCDCVPFV